MMVEYIDFTVLVTYLTTAVTSVKAPVVERTFLSVRCNKDARVEATDVIAFVRSCSWADT